MLLHILMTSVRNCTCAIKHYLS